MSYLIKGIGSPIEVYERMKNEQSRTELRILTLWQPWATLIALGLKQYKTRSWSTNYRGKLAIHAAKRYISGSEWQEFIYRARALGVGSQVESALAAFTELPHGSIVAIADLTDCREMIDVASRNCSLHPALQIDSSAQTPLEKAVGDWSELRYAWKMENVTALPEPIPFKGKQGLTFAPEAIREQLAVHL